MKLSATPSLASPTQYLLYFKGHARGDLVYEPQQFIREVNRRC